MGSLAVNLFSIYLNQLLKDAGKVKIKEEWMIQYNSKATQTVTNSWNCPLLQIAKSGERFQYQSFLYLLIMLILYIIIQHFSIESKSTTALEGSLFRETEGMIKLAKLNSETTR